MTDSADQKTAAISVLLEELADLSGEDAALEAYRREAGKFDPQLAVVRIALELLDLETDPAERRKDRERLERLRESFDALGELVAAAMIVEGLKSVDAAERRSWQG